MAQGQLKALNDLCVALESDSHSVDCVNNCLVDSRTNTSFSLNIVSGSCDGDTSHADRDYLRKFADIIVSNPDMLHCTILPQVGCLFV